MKSRAKVISQKHIREIPTGMFGMRHRGIMQHGIDNRQETQQQKRQRRQHRIKQASRRMNRTSK